MQSDEIVWQIINHGHCSYKIKEESALTFCRNAYNVTGLCNRSSCPLANSNYSTILEQNGTLFLCLKSVERAHTPAAMWQLVRLDENYEKAFHQVSKALEYWPKFLAHKNKQRLTKITQYLIRTRNLAKNSKGKIVSIPKKEKKKEERSEGKAQIAARIDSSIEQELLKRLKSGLYNDIYSFSSAQYEGEIIEQEQNQGKESHLQRGSALKQRKIKERREHIELEYE
jgi:protein MAK16